MERYCGFDKFFWVEQRILQGGHAVIEEIQEAIRDAARGGQKMAMFHFQVLKNAAALEGTDPQPFCREIDVPETYQT